ncbi:6249_t:CDS:2, partial [Funneliformis mosseae]
FFDGPARKVEMLVNSLNNQKLLNPEEYLSCIPPAVIYPENASQSRRSTNIGKRIIEVEVKRDCVIKKLYEDEFDELFRYENEHFIGHASGNLKIAFRQLYNYMIADGLQYGSTTLPVLKTYVCLLNNLTSVDSESSHSNVIPERTRQDTKNQNLGSNNQSSNQSQNSGS